LPCPQIITGTLSKNNMAKILRKTIFLSIIGLGLLFFSFSLAQAEDNQTTTINAETNVTTTSSATTTSATTTSATTTGDAEAVIDETVNAKDLGVSEPNLLPTSRFYFLKKWQRGIQKLFTFGALKKAELRTKFAAEKLLEIRKIAQKTKNPEILKKAIKNYKKETDKIKENVDKIKDKAKDNPKVGKFLDQSIELQALHEKILEKLEQNEKIATSTLERIKEVRERHLQRFGEVMAKLEDKEKIGERLEKVLSQMEGSQFKNFKNVQILKRIEENAPQDIKEEIEKTERNITDKIKERLEKMPPQAQERFKNYIEKVSGSPEKKTEIINNISSRIKNRPDVLNKLRTVKAKIERKQNNKNILDYKDSPISIDEAKKIAANSECAKIGEISPIALYNKATHTWWMNIKVYDKVWQEKKMQKNMCRPGCVVNALTREAKINWRCADLTIPPRKKHLPEK